jgi:AraC-like DNA-binding protein
MICERSIPLARIALACGFNSQSHFTTAFVRYFARTPAAYRRAI